jgi:RNA polymerase sigma factor (sigma-70 family)
MVSPGSTVATDEQLVVAAREGSDEAFEALFRRYRDRIAVHVRGMVHDRSRAEDIVQDTFVSALRSLRATDQEIVFRPWIYQIARNACIDHLRRVKRTEEVSIDSDEFRPDFEGRLSGTAPETYATVAQRQSLDDLQQAFGGLPDSQHEILVLREFEGLSYEEIGHRMRLTPAAVESMLSRARRSLKGHFDEIVTGERCLRMRPVMVGVSRGLAGKRDRRILSRHLRHCRSCRHDAMGLGLASFVTNSRRSAARNALSRAASFLPLPFFRRRLFGDSGDPSAASGGVGGVSSSAQVHLAHLSSVAGTSAEQTASALQKAVAVVAVAAVASGGGIVAQRAGVGLPLPKIASKGKDATSSAAPSKDAPAPVDLAGERTAAGGGGGAGERPVSNSAGGGSLPAGANLSPTSGLPVTGESRPGAPQSGPSAPGPAGTLGPTGSPESPGDGADAPSDQTSGPSSDSPTDKLRSDKLKSGSEGDDPTDPLTSGDQPETDGSSLSNGIQHRIDQGKPLPRGIQKKLDEAAPDPPAVTTP